MNAQPLVTVLIRTKDRKHLLQETLDSVIAQTCAPLEVLIINDGGEDFAADIIPDNIQESFHGFVSTIDLCVNSCFCLCEKICYLRDFFLEFFYLIRTQI